MQRTSGEVLTSTRVVPFDRRAMDGRARASAPGGLVGQVLAGRFRIEREVGAGGFGVVYRAEQIALQRPVAIKVLGAPAERGQAWRSFETEARTVAQLRHPHIVEVHDFGSASTEGGGALHWMALEWLEGQTLQSMLEERRTKLAPMMEPAAALGLLRPVLQAIAFAHRCGVVHRDLKPANIFLCQHDGNLVPKVLDFGIARIMAPEPDGAANASGQTTAGIPAFSPDYAAPEQVNQTRTGPWTDVHALGLILTELLTGQPPYALHPEERVAEVIAERRPTPGSKGVPVGAWEPILARALARRPAERYRDGGELLRALEETPTAPARARPAGSIARGRVARAPEGQPPRRPEPEVLPAKLMCPQAADAVVRTRLFRTLDRLTRKPVTWLHAPGGAGKTTLLSTYLAARKAPVLWYDVDAGDSDVSNLYHYTRRAAEALLGRRISLPVPRPGSPDAQRVFARRFFEALFAQLPASTLVLFDNYQDAAGPAWNETFRELAAALTPRVRVVVASRTPPPAALARLVVSGDLQTLERDGLRLEQPEIKRFLRREGKGSPASLDRESARLMSLTDGWAVAVALLAKSRSETQKSRPASASGRKRSLAAGDAENVDSVFAYLATEIFERLDGPTREFLLQVALLPSFTAEMAAELTGRPDAVSLLSRLYGEQLFIEWCGDTEFRLHDLFRSFLLDRSRGDRDAAAWNQLSVRAALLLARGEQFQPAVDLLAEAQSWPELVALIERQAPVLASQGRLSTVGTAIGRLPAEQAGARPWLRFWRAASLMGQPGGQAQSLAESAFAEFRTLGDPAGTLLSWSLVVQAIVIGADDFHQLPHWLQTLDEMALEPPAPPIATAVALGEVLAYCFWEVGTPRSVEVAERALRTVREHGTCEERIHVSGAALLLFLNAGHIERAREMSRLARAEFKGARFDPLPKLAYLHSEAALGFQTGDFAASIRAVEQGLQLARTSGIEVWNGSLMVLGLLSARGRSDLATAERFLQAMAPFGTVGPAFARSQVAFGHACLAFERGELEQALRGIRGGLADATQLGFKFPLAQQTLAEVCCLAALGDRAGLDAALALLDERVRAAPGPFLEMEAQLARIYARLCGSEDVRDELRALFREERRLEMSAGCFLGPRVVARVLGYALENDVDVEHVRQLLRAYRIRLPRVSRPARPGRRLAKRRVMP